MGVDAVSTTDDLAFNSGPFISPASFRQWVVPYHQRPIKEITVPFFSDLFGMGIQGIHPIDPNCMDIREFKENCGKKVCILGNVNVNTLASGTPEETYSEVRDLIRDLGPRYGYILSSGNSVPDYVKPENMLALAGPWRILVNMKSELKRRSFPSSY